MYESKNKAFYRNKRVENYDLLLYTRYINNTIAYIVIFLFINEIYNECSAKQIWFIEFRISVLFNSLR